jgi:hypothetical protein
MASGLLRSPSAVTLTAEEGGDLGELLFEPVTHVRCENKMGYQDAFDAARAFFFFSITWGFE